MKANQQRVIDQLNAMPAEDVADLKFSTAVTDLLQRRARDFKSRAVKSTQFPMSKPAAKKTVDPNLWPFPTQTVNKQTKRMTVAQREQAAAQWAQANLRAFNIVRMNGTRDGHGMRLVVEVRNGVVVCRRFNKLLDQRAALRYPPGSTIKVQEGGVVTYYVKTDDITTHGLGKVAARFVRRLATDPLIAQPVV